MYFVLPSTPFLNCLSAPLGYKVLTQYVKLMEYLKFVRTRLQLLGNFGCLLCQRELQRFPTLHNEAVSQRGPLS